jgi:hypothetical protein
LTIDRPPPDTQKILSLKEAGESFRLYNRQHNEFRRDACLDRTRSLAGADEVRVVLTVAFLAANVVTTNVK